VIPAPPTLEAIVGYCSVCGDGRLDPVNIVKVMHPDAPMVPGQKREGHPDNCQCRPCIRLASAGGEVPQWFGFCKRCTGLLGAFGFPRSAP